MDLETGSNLEVMPPGTPASCMSPELKHHEPPMFVARPSSDQALDVSHILADVFKDLYTRDVMSKDTVKNLTCSSEGSTKFHKKCMDQLNMVHAEHQRKMEECNMLERRIIQARARAVSADTKALEHVAGNIGSERYEQLGLPPVQSHFQWCLEEAKLKEHKLIVPSDLFQKDHQLLDGPARKHTPHFSIPTVSSSLHFLKEKLDDGYDLEPQQEKINVLFETANNDEKSIATLSSDSADLTSIPPRTPINKKRKVLPSQDRWRENMKHEARVEDRAMLVRLEERHNFLKNPRYLPVTETKLLTKEHPKQMVLKAGREISQNKCEDDIQVFECNPAVVTFTDWIVGRVYECVLEVRNISSVSRQLRVLPPKTSYFSLGLGKYPGAEGSVAPGMNAQYNIRFMPDSLSNYKDEIEIISQSASPLYVTIQGKRPPPVLSIADTLNCGYCLVGGVKMTELPIKNFGGSGRFCVLKKTSWPAANFKTLVNPGCLDVGPFKIRPAVFEIMAGQKISIELLFSPHTLGKFKEELVIVCDNCQVKYFTIEGEGESASVELVSVSDDGLKEPGIHEIKDITADHLVKFPQLNPHSFYMRQLILHNSANVELPFSWHILKPNLAPAIKQLNLEDRNEKVEFYPDLDSSFFVEPKEGVLQPNGIHEFVLTFAPNKVEKFHNTFHLVLSNIPDVKKDVSHPNTSDSLNIDGKSEKKTFEEAAPRLARSNSGTMHTTPQLLPLREVIALEVEVKGESIPYSVLLHPPAVMVPGSILTGATVKRPLRMANYSLAPVEFQWSNESSSNIVEVEPPLGIINPGDVAELEVSVTGLRPGPLFCQLLCHIEHQEKPMTLNVNAQIKGPKVVIDNVCINFDLIKLDYCVTEELYIRNTTQLNAQWNLSLTSPEKFGEVLFMSPSFGELGSLQQQSVKVTFKPKECQSINTTIQLDVKGGESSSVAVKGEVQTQQVCFDDCTVVLKDIFLSVPKRAKVTLINQTLFPTAFWFKEHQGKQANVCEIRTEPKQGVLKPREELEVEVTVVINAQGELTEVYLPCVIEGTKKPIVLGFYADVGCLNVVFSTPDNENDQELKVVFGESVAVGKSKTSRILFTNTTAIRSPWSAAIKTYKGQSQSVRKSNHDFKSVKSRRAMLGRTPNLADPLSKTPAQAFSEYARLLLSEGKGCAFTLEPSKGYLDPYQTQEITVTSYNDMWGQYVDEITCRVEGLDNKTIPVELNVTGCPLSFQIANQVNKHAVARYGTHLEGGATVARKLQINNSSSVDIRLDWKTYNYPKPEDKKLVDLNIWFGEDFPKITKKNSHGKSITSLSQQSISTKVDKKDLDKLVHVRIEPHFGEKSELPFHIEPSQIIVPAHGRTMVSGIFKPVIGGPCVNGEYNWKAYGLGYMSLDQMLSGQNINQLSRPDGYSVEPLRIEFRSTVRAGMLDINVDVDEENTFYQPLSNLLDENSKLKNESIQLRSCVLTNATETPLSFHLSTEAPFFVTSSTGPDPPRATTLARNVLRPQTNLKAFPPSLEHLNVSNNRFEFIERDAFKGLAGLKTLNMNGLLMKKMHNGRQFRSLTSLIELSISGENIEAIESGIFSRVKTLEKLSLTNTQLEFLPRGIFSLLENLSTLNLNHNRLSYIPPSTFLANSKMNSLSLDNNQFSDLMQLSSALLSLKNLTTLSLQGNGILEQPDTLIERLNALQELDFSGNSLASLTANLSSPTLRLLNFSSNQISEIHEHVFTNLTSLTVVDLSGNRLTSLPTISKEEKSISQLVVSGNSWHCDCDLLYSYMELKQGNVNLDCTYQDTFRDACVVCSTPVSVEGRLISELRPSDVSNCSGIDFPAAKPQSDVVDIIGIMGGVLIAFVLIVVLILFLKRGGLEKVKTLLKGDKKHNSTDSEPPAVQPEIAEYGSIDTVSTTAYSVASDQHLSDTNLKQLSGPPRSPLNLYQPASPVEQFSYPKSSPKKTLPIPSMFHQYESIKSLKKPAQRESSLNPYIFPESSPETVTTPDDSASPYLEPMQAFSTANPYEIPMASGYMQFGNGEKAANVYEMAPQEK